MIGEIYRSRWQYAPPWAITRPWLPRVGTGADEFCNPSVWVILPLFLGQVVIFWRPGPLRTEEDGLCDACQWEMEYDRQMGWTPSLTIIDETRYWVDGIGGEDDTKK